VSVLSRGNSDRECAGEADCLAESWAESDDCEVTDIEKDVGGKRALLENRPSAVSYITDGPIQYIIVIKYDLHLRRKCCRVRRTVVRLVT
jgi:hypothetical protein